MHWKGLWFAFARHGEVANVYIARRRSRGGKRFGFVRMKGLETAERVMNRLHGFILYGSKLTVKRARNNLEGVRKRFRESLSQKPGTQKISVGGSLGHGEGIGISGPRLLSDDIVEVPMVDEKPKKIAGHVEDEDLWRLRRCLVGVSDTICSVSSIHLRLVTWGLGEINVQRLGGLNGVEIGAGDTRNRDGETEGKRVTEEANNVNPSQEQLGGELGRVSTMEQGTEYQLISDVLCQSGPQSLRAGAGPDACSMGFLDIDDYLGGADLPLLHNQKVPWVDIVSGKGNSGLLVSKGPGEGKVAERGSDKDFVVDSDKDWVNRRKRNAKKYGSIRDIQNQSISEFEKRRRDRVFKKSSWSKEQLEDTELSGKSLSDSDINYRVSMIVKEVKQILDVGKRIGVNFVGNENEVINDLVDIELKA
ncbi:hypothetical protein GQ457_04G012440 [Hibiscus cannabinus]